MYSIYCFVLFCSASKPFFHLMCKYFLCLPLCRCGECFVLAVIKQKKKVTFKDSLEVSGDYLCGEL